MGSFGSKASSQDVNPEKTQREIEELRRRNAELTMEVQALRTQLRTPGSPRVAAMPPSNHSSFAVLPVLSTVPPTKIPNMSAPAKAVPAVVPAPITKSSQYPPDYKLENFKSYFSVIHREPDNCVPPLEELEASRASVLKKLVKYKFVSAKTPDFVFKLCRETQAFFSQPMLVNNFCDEFEIQFHESLAETDHVKNFLFSKYNVPMDQYIEKYLQTMFNNVKLETQMDNQIPVRCWEIYYELLKTTFQLSMYGYKMIEENVILNEKKAVIYPGWTYNGTTIKPSNIPRSDCQDIFL